MNKLYLFILLIAITSCQKPTKGIVSNDNASFFDLNLFEDKIKIDSVALNNTENKLLIDFYKSNNYQTVWQSEEHRKFVLQEIGNAENEGLDPIDYWYNSIKKNESNYDDLTDEQLVNYDLLLTQSMQSYISHISKGKVNPLVIYNDYDLKEKIVDVNSILRDCIDKNDFPDIIEDCKPSHPMYKNLKESLRILKAYPKVKTENFDSKTPKLIPGKSYKAIVLLKRKINYWKDAVISDSLSNVYDKETVAGVKNFQKRHGLFPDGVVGAGTIEVLNFTREQRIKQVCANLERWRWYAKDFGSNYLLINIPDYSLVAIKDGDTTQKQRVVVGKKTRQTPVLESKISNINLNPNWTVPPTILAEDVFPDAIKDRSKFNKDKLKIYNWKKQEISPWQWKIEDANKYHYVQLPGRNSALGLMKINFKNKYSVYLHDTNHRDYFKFTYRALSSGCVRLEKPLEMAEYILNDEENWPLEKIQDTTNINHYIKLKREKFNEQAKKDAARLAKNPLLVITPKKFVNPELKTIVLGIKDDIFVHQLYWTAWQNNGVLQFREDIYCRDSDLFAYLYY